MIEKRSPIMQSFDLVMNRVREIYLDKFGKESGVKSWLARELGAFPQSITNWGVRGTGIPPEHVAKVADLTGLRPDDVRPPTVVIEVRKPFYDRMAKAHPKEVNPGAIVKHPRWNSHR